MRIAFVLALAGMLLAGCEPLNGGGGPAAVVINSVSVVPSAGLRAGDTVTVTVNFTGEGQLDLSLDMGGGTQPDTLELEDVTSPLSQVFTLSEDAGGTFDAMATVTAAAGGASDSATFQYTYEPAIIDPGIGLVLTVNGSVLTAMVADVNGNDITLTVGGVTGGSVTPASTVISGGSGSFDFSISAADQFAGGTVSGTVTASDGGFSEEETFSVSIPGIALAADTLYAIPRSTIAALGEPVRIVVATGSPANPFQFLNAVRVTGPAGFTYVDDSFDIGSYNTEVTQFPDVDGIWEVINPSGLFLTGPDSFIVETPGLPDPDSTGQTGRTAIDFNVTPLEGTDTSIATGELFSFEATFAAGVNVLGFQDIGGVDRTFYTDSNTAPNHFWADTTNDHEGVPNSVTVE